ncbi:MAG: GNAT family N-acetyltransferase [Dehalococcoidales bacterium]|nr:GNAT family N-acetyltransferase [Dehalococcoidales bacterium]
MIIGNKVRLRDRKLGDAPNDYSWQANPELAQLNASPPLTIPFTQYLLTYLEELLSPPPTQHNFVIETRDSQHIGNCFCYHINRAKHDAEIGITIGNRNYQNRGYGTDAIITLLDYIFQTTSLNRIYLKTLVSNQQAQQCFKKCGFTPSGYLDKDDYSFILMETRRKQWQEQRLAKPITPERKPRRG